MSYLHAGAPGGAAGQPCCRSCCRRALILFTLFVMPLLNAGYCSFFKWNGYGPPTDFVGLRNCGRAFGHSIFWVSVRNAVLVLAVSLCIQMPIALALALAIYRKTPTNALFRLIFFLPCILAAVAAGLIWSFVFDADTGLAAAITHALGPDPVFVLANRNHAFYAICVVVVWKYFGFYMMICIAALQAVQGELIEAARIEGARRWNVIRHVQIPQIRPARHRALRRLDFNTQQPGTSRGNLSRSEPEDRRPRRPAAFAHDHRGEDRTDALHLAGARR